MITVAITGGIAMGKSTVSASLRESFPTATFFDADACVAELLTRADICTRIASEFGQAALAKDGRIDRAYLRDQVFDSAERRAVLENILHPEVRGEFLAARQSGGAGPDPVMFADIPLLFESGHDYQADLVLVVATGGECQMRRLLARPGITPETARQMVAAQMPIGTKMRRADHVIWNAGSTRILHQQTQQFARWLKRKIQEQRM